MNPIFFEDWQSVIRVIVVSACAYFLLILFLRISGKRTLTQMNAFDFVITVALGSTLSSTIITKNVTLAEGVVALAMLILLQLVISWSSVRFPFIDRLVKAEPVSLVKDGTLQKETMKRERITEEEVRAAIRQGSWDEMEDVALVILESNGRLNVVYRRD